MLGVAQEALRRLALRKEARGGWKNLPAEQHDGLLHAASDPQRWLSFLRSEKRWTFAVRQELSDRLVDWIPRLDEIFEDGFVLDSDEDQIEPSNQLDYLVLDSENETDTAPEDSGAGRRRKRPQDDAPEDSAGSHKVRKLEVDAEPEEAKDSAVPQVVSETNQPPQPAETVPNEPASATIEGGGVGAKSGEKPADGTVGSAAIAETAESQGGPTSGAVDANGSGASAEKKGPFPPPLDGSKVAEAPAPDGQDDQHPSEARPAEVGGYPTVSQVPPQTGPGTQAVALPADENAAKGSDPRPDVAMTNESHGQKGTAGLESGATPKSAKEDEASKMDSDMKDESQQRAATAVPAVTATGTAEKEGEQPSAPGATEQVEESLPQKASADQNPALTDAATAAAPSFPAEPGNDGSGAAGQVPPADAAAGPEAGVPHSDSKVQSADAPPAGEEQAAAKSTGDKEAGDPATGDGGEANPEPSKPVATASEEKECPAQPPGTTAQDQHDASESANPPDEVAAHTEGDRQAEAATQAEAPKDGEGVQKSESEVSLTKGGENVPKPGETAAPKEDGSTVGKASEAAPEGGDNPPKQAGDAAAPKDGETASEQAGDAAAQKDADSAVEQPGTPAALKDGDGAPEQSSGAPAPKNAENAAEQAGDAAAPKNEETAAEQASGAAAPKDEESALEKGGDVVAPQDRESAPEQAGDTAALKDGETAPDQAGDAAVPREAETAPDQAGDAAAPKEAETAPDQAGDATAPKEAETAPDHAGDAAAPKEAETAPDQAGDAAATKAAETAPDQAGDEAAPKEALTAPDQAGDKAAPENAENAPDQAAEAAAPKDAENAPDQAVDSAAPKEAENAPEQANDAAAPKDGENAPEQAGDSAAPKDGENAHEQVADAAPPKDGEKAPDQAADAAAQKDGDTAPDQAGDAAEPKEAEIAPDQEGDSAAPKDAENAPDQAGDPTAPKAAENAPEQAGDSAAPKDAENAPEELGDSAAPKDGENAPEQAADAAAPKDGEKASDQAADAAAPKDGESAPEQASAAGAAKEAEPAPEQSGDNTAAKIEASGPKEASENPAPTGSEETIAQLGEAAPPKDTEGTKEPAKDGEEGAGNISEASAATATATTKPVEQRSETGAPAASEGTPHGEAGADTGAEEAPEQTNDGVPPTDAERGEAAKGQEQTGQAGALPDAGKAQEEPDAATARKDAEAATEQANEAAVDMDVEKPSQDTGESTAPMDVEKVQDTVMAPKDAEKPTDQTSQNAAPTEAGKIADQASQSVVPMDTEKARAEVATAATAAAAPDPEGAQVEVAKSETAAAADGDKAPEQTGDTAAVPGAENALDQSGQITPALEVEKQTDDAPAPMDVEKDGLQADKTAPSEDGSARAAVEISGDGGKTSVRGDQPEVAVPGAQADAQTETKGGPEQKEVPTAAGDPPESASGTESKALAPVEDAKETGRTADRPQGAGDATGQEGAAAPAMDVEQKPQEDASKQNQPASSAVNENAMHVAGDVRATGPNVSDPKAGPELSGVQATGGSEVPKATAGSSGEVKDVEMATAATDVSKSADEPSKLPVGTEKGNDAETLPVDPAGPITKREQEMASNDVEMTPVDAGAPMIKTEPTMPSERNDVEMTPADSAASTIKAEPAHVAMDVTKAEPGPIGQTKPGLNGPHETDDREKPTVDPVQHQILEASAAYESSNGAKPDGERLVDLAARLCHLIAEHGERQERVDASAARTALERLGALTSADVAEVRARVRGIMKSLSPSVRRYFSRLPASVKQLFGMRTRDLDEGNRLQVSMRRARRKALRDSFLASCSSWSRAEVSDRPALVRCADGTAKFLSQEKFEDGFLPEYADLGSSVLRAPAFPPTRSVDADPGGRGATVYTQQGVLHRNVLTMDELRTIRSRKTPSKRERRSELVITNRASYFDGIILGDQYAKDRLAQSAAHVLAHEGFTTASASGLEVLADMAESFIRSVGKALSGQRTARVLAGKGDQNDARKRHQTSVRHKLVDLASYVSQDPFRGGFADLVAYKEQQVELVSAALKEAEAKVKKKIPDWEKYLAVKEDHEVFEAGGTQLNEMERIFGMFPDHVSIELSDDMPVPIPRSLAQKVVDAGWPVE